MSKDSKTTRKEQYIEKRKLNCIKPGIRQVKEGIYDTVNEGLRKCTRKKTPKLKSLTPSTSGKKRIHSQKRK